MGVNTNNAIHTHSRDDKRGGNAEVSVYKPYSGAWRSALHPNGDDHTTTRGYYRGYIRKTAFTPRSRKMCKKTKTFEHGGHHYWFSGDEENFTDHKVDWLDGRNICREYCMDLVSLETPTENELIEKFLVEHDLPYIWTAGRLCNFKGCDRDDLQPPTVNGWFWSGSGVKMAPTNSTPPGWSYQPWSYTGHKTQFESKNISQPDNAEFDINGSVEACMGLLNDIYDDGIKWHDIACYHTKPFICEDSEQLLEYVQTVEPDLEF